jgi:hypothetical protein
MRERVFSRCRTYVGNPMKRRPQPLDLVAQFVVGPSRKIRSERGWSIWARHGSPSHLARYSAAFSPPLDNVRHRTVTAIMKYKTPNTARIAIRPKSRS